MSEKVDFIDWQSEQLKQFAEEAGLDREAVEEETKKLKILRFDKNPKQDNVVSWIDKTIVFVDWDYRGEPIQIGEVWMCSVTRDGSVFYAVPLKKITSSLMLGLDETLRRDILDELFETNRDKFEKPFDERIRQEIAAEEYSRAKSEHEQIIEKLREEVGYLEAENEKLTALSRRSVVIDDEIELFSETRDSEEIEIVADAPIVKRPRGIPRNPRPIAPGVPAFRTISPRNSELTGREFRVERRAEETIYCEDFIDARYFVHISPNGKYLVVRPDEYGTVVSYEKHKIRLDGLGKFSSFSERYDMVAEYSDFYGGLLIHLQPPARTD